MAKANKTGKGKKLSAAHKAKLRAAVKRRWAARKGSGKPGKGNHIPLKVLKSNMHNLQKLILVREKNEKAWA